jgi:putative ABC transport system ATP-binding protein
MPEQPILKVRGLTREFVRRGKPFPAVDDVNLTLDPGEFMAIVGRSGNGKSTLLNLVTGLLKPTSGSILLAGNEVTTLNDKQMSILRNRTIGFVTQIQTLLPNLTAIDNVVLPAVLHRNPSRYETEIDERTNDAQSQEQTASSVVVDGLPDVIQPAGFFISARPFDATRATSVGSTACRRACDMLSEGALWWRDAPRLHRPSVDEQAETADRR